MGNYMTRIIIENILRRTLKDLKESPERSLRNLVDMALDFSESKLQRSFFETAEDVLKDSQSPYYDIIRDCSAHIEDERLFKFGMNLCYNSCTLGANIISKNEKSLGFNIPWAISIKLDEKRLSEQPESCDSVLTQGEELGIYTWLLQCKENPGIALPLVRNHSDSAIILFCEPENITDEFSDDLADLKHIMLAVRLKENTENKFRLMREKQLLYSAYYIYGEEEAENIINGNLFYDAAQLHPLFTAVIPDESISEETREKVYNTVKSFRKKSGFKTIAVDISLDNKYIDNIISDDETFPIWFDSDGSLYTGRENKLSRCLFSQNLKDILKQNFPK
ncbi:MAG: hypothetical protein LIO87_07435 [Eubacterium sp.]|nr:hypothetical protein [Eubacterium sp.]